MSRWRPSPAEERWLEVASELGTAVPRAAVAERTGGWRSTGPLARIALFVLGFVAAALLLAILGFDDDTLLVAGLIAAAPVVGPTAWDVQLTVSAKGEYGYEGGETGYQRIIYLQYAHSLGRGNGDKNRSPFVIHRFYKIV